MSAIYEAREIAHSGSLLQATNGIADAIRRVTEEL